jgi:hypothetical protein
MDDPGLFVKTLGSRTRRCRLGRVSLSVSQLGYGDGEPGQTRDKHQRRSVRLVLCHREGEQPGRGSQTIPGR